MNPTTVQNVVTYDTIIIFDNPDMKLFPGMTAYVTVPVANANNVLKVPNGALRFTPTMKPEELQAVLQQNGIQANTARRQRTQGQAQAGDAPQKPAATGSQTILWKLTAEKKLVPVQVQTGITDHTYTEVAQLLHGDLKPGEELVVGAAGSGSAAATGKSGTPAPGGMRGVGR